MRYVKRRSFIEVIGRNWYGLESAYTYQLDDSALKSINDDSEAEDACAYSRRAVEAWLMLHSEDLQTIEDFAVTISDKAGLDFDSGWEKEEESACKWNDMMYEEEA